MTPNKILKAFVVAVALPLLYMADAGRDAAPGLTLNREAHAIVGAPLGGILGRERMFFNLEQAVAKYQALSAQDRTR